MRIDKDNSPGQSEKTSSKQTKRIGGRIWTWILIILVALLIGHAIRKKIVAGRETRHAVRESAYPIIHVTYPKVAGTQKELVLPGTVTALEDTPIYARTSGYLKRWLVDIGTRVQANQLLAEIESPEVDQQFNQALGSLQQAQADANLAWITTVRWRQMLARNTVSRQEADEKQGSYEAQRASLLSAQANLDRLKELKGFENVYAPFNGVITARNANVGDLITANNTSQPPMFRIADDRQLRIYLSVPENAASFIKVGQLAHVVLASAPGVVTAGTVRHVASAIDPGSRTMLTEVRLDNSKHAFLSGGYATVSFDLKLAKPSITIPVNTLLFRPEGTFVGVVDKDERVSLHKITIGKDYGNFVEATEGISPTDRIIVNPSDSLQQGDRVRVANDKKP